MENNRSHPVPRGRGAASNPATRFGDPYVVPDLDQLEPDDDHLDRLARVPTTYLPDRSKTVISENDSPDVGFRYSLNPYRGCVHGCSYCYARPTHEYLGYSAGVDFESRILVKADAPVLFEAFLRRRSWVPEPICLSGVTDPYQPCERHFRVTRGCLDVAARFRQPIDLITKNALITRDLDQLGPMAHDRLVHAHVSLTTLDARLARALEPRASAPDARLRAIADLAAAGVPVCVMLAPIIPGLTDAEIPALLEAARRAGATAAGWQMVRLPQAVGPIFLEWLDQHYPDRRARVESRIRAMRDGQLNTSQFGDRMRGRGEHAQRTGDLFRLFARKLGLDRPLPALDATRFQIPQSGPTQQWLF